LTFPPAGTALAVRVARLFSTLLGIAFILLVYAATSRLLNNSTLGLLAAGLAAFNLKFVHMSSIVTNDIAVATAGALALFVLVCLWRSEHKAIPHAQRRQRWLLLALGAVIGIAYLCKSNGISLAIPAAITIAWLTLKAPDRRLRVLITNGFICLAGFLTTAGWYLLYCTLRYGDPLALKQVQLGISFMLRTAPLGLADIPAAVATLIASYWGIFGHGVRWAAAFDLAPLLLFACAIIGLGMNIIRRRNLDALVLCGMVASVAIIAFLPWFINNNGGEFSSRLMAPGFAALQVLLVSGLAALIPERLWHRASYIAPAVSFALAAVIVPALLIPAYNVPHYLSLAEEQQLPADVKVLFDNGIRLEAVSINNTRFSPGDVMTMTAFWRATRPIDRMHVLVIDVRDTENRSVVRTDIAPMADRFNTSRWGSGILRDSYQIRLPATPTQTIASIFLGWHAYDNAEDVAHVVGSEAVSAQVAQIKIRGIRPSEIVPAYPVSSTLGADIALEGYSIDGDHVRLFWRARGTPVRNYTDFVHALDASGAQLAQADHPPAYRTEFWEAGEQIIDDYIIPGANAISQLQVGMYDPVTGARLPAFRPDGSQWTDNIIVITR
ncbi:MAG TPA: glycosyltransferase family 39 protein, partial [Anaerolineae bacterium]